MNRCARQRRIRALCFVLPRPPRCHRRVDPLLIVLVGTVVMVTCLMVFRLHAFLALVAGALVVCLLTPAGIRHWQALRPGAVPVAAWDPAAGIVTFDPKAKLPAEGRVRFFAKRTEGAVSLATALLLHGKDPDGKSWHVTDLSAPVASVEGLWLASSSSWDAAAAQSARHPLDVVADGFGETCRGIGLLIVLASVIGQCLTESGAADRIVRWIQAKLGEPRASLGFALSGFVLGIPVFFDTVFYLLMPLGRGLAARTGRDFLLYTLSIVAGATMAHSLVPPTPGPLFAAGAFGVPIGMMMVGGLVVGGLPVMAGLAYARWANRRWPLPLRPIGGLGAGDAPEQAVPRPGPLPALGLSVLPIALPVVLIAASESLKAFAPATSASGWTEAVHFLGQTQMSLLLGTAVAVLLLVRQSAWRWKVLKDALAPAVASGGVILLITAAGGAFGAALRQTDVASRLAAFSGSGHFALLFAAFAVTALVRIAQGSATVAMITAAGVVAPLAAAATLPYHPVYLALAVGCGSKPVPWLNDSGFWIISRMSGMTETETLRSASVMMSLMGCAGFVLVLLGAWLLPMV